MINLFEIRKKYKVELIFLPFLLGFLHSGQSHFELFLVVTVGIPVSIFTKLFKLASLRGETAPAEAGGCGDVEAGGVGGLLIEILFEGGVL